MKQFLPVILLLLFFFACSQKEKSPTSKKIIIPVDSIASGQLQNAFSKAKKNNLNKRATKIQFRIYKEGHDDFNRAEIDSVFESLNAMAQRSGSDYLKGKVFYERARYFKRKDQSDSAYFNYNKAESFFKKGGDSLIVARILMAKSALQLKGSDNFGARQTAIKSLDFLKANHNLYRSAAFNLAGITSQNMKQYPEALHWYRKAIELDPTSKNIPIFKNNIALVYFYQKKVNEAIDIWEKIKHEPVLTQNRYTRVKLLDNLGFAYAKKKDLFKKGMRLMQKAYQKRVEMNDEGGQSLSCLHFAEIFLKKDPEQSFKWARQALNLTTDPVLQLRAFYLMGRSDIGETSEFLSKYSHLRDSLNLRRRKSSGQFAKIRFESERKQRKILQLENLNSRADLQIQDERTFKVISIGITAFILIIATMLYFFMVRRHKENNRLAVYKREKELSKNLHDGVANDVYQIMNSLENNPKGQAHNVLLDRLDDVYEKTRNVSRSIDTSSLLENYSERLLQMINSYQNGSVNIMTRNYSAENLRGLRDEKKVDIYRILQELLTNMIKHSGADLVVVQFDRDDQKFEITYRDNGKGFEKNHKISKNGLQNVENRIKKQNGHITFESNSNRGIVIRLSFSP
jgi:signal transduction histidine kinase/tetratricopeptide (TPR) repeat protein